VQEVESLLKDVYEAISNAVLLCELTQRARVSQLIKLGFDLDPEPPRRLTLNELLGLFTGLSVVFSFGFVVMHRLGGSQLQLSSGLFARVIMIATIYCVAVWCAIHPKARWSSARRQSGQGRPWAWYLLSGVIAAAAGALINYAVRLIAVHGDFAKAWDLYWQTRAWGVMTFATAYGLAFLADDEPQDGFMGLLTANRLRWLEGLALTAVMAAAGWMVHSLLLMAHETAVALNVAPLLDVRPLRDIEILSVLSGFAIGYLVPAWYRHAPREAQCEVRVRLTAAVTAAQP
jgi:hypothetical protein